MRSVLLVHPAPDQSRKVAPYSSRALPAALGRNGDCICGAKRQIGRGTYCLKEKRGLITPGPLGLLLMLHDMIDLKVVPVPAEVFDYEATMAVSRLVFTAKQARVVKLRPIQVLFYLPFCHERHKSPPIH